MATSKILSPLSALYSRHKGSYWMALRCETNGSSAPDGAEPSTGVTWARASAGALTCTLDSGFRPQQVLGGFSHFEETDADIRAVYTGYTASSGVVTVSTQQQNASTAQNGYLLTLTATSGGGSNPAALLPASGVAWAITGTGSYTATISSAANRPTLVYGGWGYMITDNVETQINVISYTPGTGVVVFKSYGQDAGGVTAAENITGAEVFGLTLHCGDVEETLPVGRPSVFTAADTNDKTLVTMLLCA